jgi:hypothetical protein
MRKWLLDTTKHSKKVNESIDIMLLNQIYGQIAAQLK